jgi:hypothetical protein
MLGFPSHNKSPLTICMVVRVASVERRQAGCAQIFCSLTVI